MVHESEITTTCEKLARLESTVLEKGNDMTSEDAAAFHDNLIRIYKEFIKSCRTGYVDYDQHCPSDVIYCNCADFVQRKVLHLEKTLLRFFTPVYSVSTSSTVSDAIPTMITDQLTALIQKQKFYIKIINSLGLVDDLSSKEAVVQYEHINKYHDKFITNQTEINALIRDDDQIDILLEVQRKVRKIQTKLKEMSLIETTPAAMALPTNSSLNEHFIQIERPRVIVDYVDSLLKKQKSLIEQIELIESKNHLGATESETSHYHLLQLNDAFVKNQSKIETYVSGTALDEQLRISGEILQKVMTVQTKLKNVFSQVKSPSEDDSSEKDLLKLSDSVDYLNWLYERRAVLMKRFEKFYGDSGPCDVELLREWFVLYQNKIEQLVSEFPYDLKKEKYVSEEFGKKVSEYLSWCEIHRYK